MIYIEQILSNKAIGVSIISWAVAQIIKIIIDWIEFKKFDIALAVSSGGMPSSHSSFVTALSTTIGIQNGFDSSIFAVCFVISMVVMYDAAGVRRAAGKQAAVLNVLITNAEKHGVKFDEKLKELLGHSPVEVAAGAVLGIVIAFIFAAI